MLYREPDARLIMDSLLLAAGRTNIFDVINGKFAAVEIIGSYPNKLARIRGINSINLSTTLIRPDYRSTLHWNPKIEIGQPVSKWNNYSTIYLATLTARFSRMTVTLIWPGYCISS